MENLILAHLLHNEEYVRKVVPYLKPEYFHKPSDKLVFSIVQEFIEKYNTLPSKEACFIDLSNKDNLNEADFKECQSIISALEVTEKTELSWLLAKTEEFCKEKALYNVIRQSIAFLDDKTGKLGDKGVLTKLFADALAVSFDSSIGHDFLVDYKQRYDIYHSTDKKIPFDLELFNKITKGGISRKTLTILMAGPGGGKSLFMCHFAAANLVAGYNVLYITMEMSQEMIAERIDANVLNIDFDRLKRLAFEDYEKRIEKAKAKTNGKLIIKEYPTAAASAANFRHLLNELKLKRNFVPDVIYVDYINICTSSRMKYGSNINSYTYVKSIAEELRGLAVEFDVPVITATQINRPGLKNSDPDMANTSDSLGLPQTADIMLALITSDQLESLNQTLVKQLKNRYNDPSYYRRFVVGVDKTKMRLYDVEQKAQDDIVRDDPVMDSTPFGYQDSFEDKEAFKDFK